MVIMSCSKEPTTYKLTFNNISSDFYKVEIIGKTEFYLSGGTYVNKYYPKGTYSYKATQQDGYILYPTVVEKTVNLEQDKIVTIP